MATGLLVIRLSRPFAAKLAANRVMKKWFYMTLINRMHVRSQEAFQAFHRRGTLTLTVINQIVIPTQHLDEVNLFLQTVICGVITRLTALPREIHPINRKLHVNYSNVVSCHILYAFIVIIFIFLKCYLVIYKKGL